MIEGGLLIEFGNDQAPINLRFSLSDSDVQLLEAFLEESNRLFQSIRRIGGFDAKLHINANQDSGVQFTSTEPEDDHRAIVLHRLRPLILQGEPFAFHNICAIVSQSTQDLFLRKHIKELRRSFYCDHFQEMIKISHDGTILNSEHGFLAWLNGFEYHRDQAKADSISSSSDLINISQLRPIYIMMASEKIKAIQALAIIASKMLEVPKE